MFEIPSSTFQFVSTAHRMLRFKICRFSPFFWWEEWAIAFSLEKSRGLYLVIGPMWQKFIYLSIPQYSKTDQPIPLFGPRSAPFASSDGVFLQAKCSKIKGWVEGWRSGKKLPFKRTTVCLVVQGVCKNHLLKLDETFCTYKCTYLCQK